MHFCFGRRASWVRRLRRRAARSSDDQVTVADISQSSLEGLYGAPAGEPRAERLRSEVADVRDASAIDGCSCRPMQ